MNYQLTHLFKLSEDEFLKPFTQVPTECRSLNLTRNDLGNRSGNLLARIVFPAKLCSLDISSNKLIKKSGMRLAQFFSVFPPLTSLNLNRNSLFRKSDSQYFLDGTFSFLKNAEPSYAEYKSGNELATAFTALPKTLTNLDLRENELNILPLEEMMFLKGKLPQINTVYLSYEEMNAMTKEQRQAIRDIFPNAKNILIYKEKKVNATLITNVKIEGEPVPENAEIDNEQLYTEDISADLITISNNHRYNIYYT